MLNFDFDLGLNFKFVLNFEAMVSALIHLASKDVMSFSIVYMLESVS